MSALAVDEVLIECVLFDMGMSQSHGNLAKPSLWGEAQSLSMVLLCMLTVCTSMNFYK